MKAQTLLKQIKVEIGNFLKLKFKINTINTSTIHNTSTIQNTKYKYNKYKYLKCLIQQKRTTITIWYVQIVEWNMKTFVLQFIALNMVHCSITEIRLPKKKAPSETTKALLDLSTMNNWYLVLQCLWVL
jgi:hypothetical protein